MASSSSLTALVTGSSSGVGLCVAKNLYLLGYNVYLGVRNKEKCEEAIAKYRTTTSTGTFTILEMDLSSIQSTKDAAEKLDRNLDVLVLNAAVVSSSKKMSVDGVEITFAAKLIGHHVLATELLNKGKLNDKCTVLCISSESVRGNIPMMSLYKPEDLAKKNNLDIQQVIEKTIKGDEKIISSFSGQRSYSTANYFFSLYALTLSNLAQIKEKQISVFSVSPGNVPTTSIAREAPQFILSILNFFMHAFGVTHSEEEASKRYLALIQNPENFSKGCFYGSPKTSINGPLTLNDFPHLLDTKQGETVLKAVENVSGTKLN